MSSFYFLGYNFNGLEFVTFIIIPASIVLMILLYIFFNIKLIILTLRMDEYFLYKYENIKGIKLGLLKKNKTIKEKL